MPLDRLPSRLEDCRRVSVVCPHAVDNFLDYAVLHGVVEALRLAAPRARIELWLRTQLDLRTAFSSLPVDAATQLPPLGIEWLLRAPSLLGRWASGERVLLGASPAWRALLGTGRQPLIELPFDGHPNRGLSPEGWRAAGAFQRAAAAASPLWLVDARDQQPPARPKDILIYQERFHIGDTLWLTPLLRAIARLLPGARTCIVTRQACAQLLSGNPHVDEVVSYEADDSGRLASPLAANLFTRRPFDAALFGFGRSLAGRHLAEEARRRGIRLRVNVEFRAHGYRPGRSPRPFTHEAWFFWGATRHPRALLHSLLPLATGASPDFLDDLVPEYFIPADAEHEAARFLASMGGGDTIVVAPSALASEQWPAERFAGLTRWLVSRFGARALIAGGLEDGPLLQAVKASALDGSQAEAATRVVVVQQRLPVFAAIVRDSRLVVANDSAPIHLADAYGVPTLYFSRHQYVPHSHPARATAWALFDAAENRLANITLRQATDAIEAMGRAGHLNLAEAPPHG